MGLRVASGICCTQSLLLYPVGALSFLCFSPIPASSLDNSERRGGIILPMPGTCRATEAAVFVGCECVVFLSARQLGLNCGTSSARGLGAAE